MRVSDFNFKIPKDLIARYPLTQRSSCRLLSLDGLSGKFSHGVFTDLLSKINPGDLLVFNDTRVIPARLYGNKKSGGRVEILIERILNDRHALARINTSKLKLGTVLFIGDIQNIIKVTLIARYNILFEVVFESEDQSTVLDILNKIGHIPLPPYIGRVDEKLDREMYQTVYNTTIGAVASPTAGLHFDLKLLNILKVKGAEMVFITLHIGMDTFQKIHVEKIEDHFMHSEYTKVSQKVADAIIACKKRGNKVIAIGTSAVRSLESAAFFCKKDKLISSFCDNTKIFIYPGYRFQVIDAIITNFHQPKSTLIMLISAFAGYKHTMAAYKSAVINKYRFFSYGDAMYITLNPNAPEEIIQTI